VRGELIEDPARLESLRSQWDELAASAGNPYALSGWLLPWWRHARPSDAQLRFVCAFDGDELVGVAPFFVARGPARSATYRLLGAGTSTGVEPVARVGRERECAATFAAALARTSPTPWLLRLEGVARESVWPGLLRETWPGPLHTRVRDTAPAPFVTTRGLTYEQWLDSVSRKFRRTLRLGERRLAEAGASVRLAPPAEAGPAVQAFVALHQARWAGRGGSGVVDPGVEQMLADLPHELEPPQLQIWLLEADGRVVSAVIFLSAGGITTSWLGGFDESYSVAPPLLLTIDGAVRHAIERGEERLDLGPGRQTLKERFADGERELAWIDLVPAGPRSVPVRLALGAGRIARSLPPGLKARLKSLLRRGGGS
jgi:CelD/BcsL family acetyltransferase involved in cellulose biosynthesis